MVKHDVYVVGMRKEYFADSGPGGISFDEEPITNEKNVLFCTTAEGNVKFVIELITGYGWCGSGYTTATQGFMDHHDVSEFGPATHLPKSHKPIKIEGAVFDALFSGGKGLTFANVDQQWCSSYIDFDIANNVFVYSDDGGDGYYPCGYTKVNYDLFEELPRAFDGRPVWIFSGQSATGKSTIGHILNESDKDVYETDSANNGHLPKEIWADVIVVGNKWKNITVEEVKKHLPEDCTAVDVTFSM